MSIIMGRGEEAKKALEGGGGLLDSTKAFIRLKAGGSVKVRILAKIDYVAYKAHGHFNNGIYTTPCIKVAGERCLLCEAADYKGDLVGDIIETVKTQKGDIVSEWASMYPKKRVLFAFVDLEEGAIGDDEQPEGMLRVFDATKNQADALISTISDYSEDLEDMAFTFKRTGEKNETTYSLNPIMPKKMKDLQDTFDKWNGKDVPDEVFEEALQPRTTEEQAKDLKKAGFPVKEVFGMDVKEEEESEEGNEPTKNDEDKGEKNAPLDVEDDDLPF